MITAEDFVLELNDTEESKNFKLATVTDLFENNTAKVQFDGEDTPSEKQYAYLASYTPKTLDRVLLAVTGGTYVILGKVNYNVSPPTEEELDRYLFDQKLVTMQKGLKVTGATTLNDTLAVGGLASLNGGVSVVGDIGVNGNIIGVNISSTGTISASGQLSGGSISTSGTLGAGATTLSSLTVSGNSVINGYEQVKSTLYAEAAFLHRGSYLSFFNKNTNASRANVSKLSGTINESLIRDKLNELIGALQLYGLIGGS